MKISPILSIVILAVGILLLVWGFNASDSLASNVSETVQGAPSDKSIALIAIGAIVAVAGLVGVLRRG